jgi:DNA-directed RNA polymerase subunit RPC12/RpoP
MPDPLGVLPWMMALPSCPKCGSRMSLVHIFPYDKGKDERTYECARCGHEVTHEVTEVVFREAS